MTGHNGLILPQPPYDPVCTAAIVCWGDAWHLTPVVSVFGSCLAIGCSHHPTCFGGGHLALVASAESMDRDRTYADESGT